MTVPRRVLTLIASLGVLPGCLVVDKSNPVSPTDVATAVARLNPPNPPSPGFATYLTPKPGEKVLLNPPAKADTVARPDPDGQRDGGVNTTSLKKTGAFPEPPNPPTSPGLIDPSQFPSQPEPVPTDPAIVAAMRSVLDNHPERALKYLDSLGKPNQDFVMELMPILLRVSRMNLSAPDPNEMTVLASQFQSIAARLERQSALQIDKILFCRQVRGFGQYVARPETQPFRPNDLAELYMEIRHLVSEPAAGFGKPEGFITRLVTSLEIRDASGRLLEQADPADPRRTVTVARTERAVPSNSPLQDFYMTYRIPVPVNPGVYTVTVEVASPGTNRAVRSQPVEFRVTGP